MAVFRYSSFGQFFTYFVPAQKQIENLALSHDFS